MQADQLVDALIADLKVAGVPSSPQGWSALRRRMMRVAAALESTPPAAGSPDQGKLFTTHEVARLLQVDPSSVAKWIDRGHLVAFKTPGRHRRIRQADLAAFSKQFGMPIASESP